MCIENALLEYPEVIVNGTEYKIYCPNASIGHFGGVDNNPSFSVNIEKKVGYCFSCGYTLGESGLSKLFNLEIVEEDAVATLKRIRNSFNTKYEPIAKTTAMPLMPPAIKWKGEFREFSEEFLTSFGALHCTIGKYADRIIFPIYINDQLLGFDSRALERHIRVCTKSNPKYLRNFGFNSKEHGLYPYDKISLYSPFLVVCEGIFHALRCHQYGIPAVCIFGAKAWTIKKLSQLLKKHPRELIIAMDNDDAGKSAEKEIVESCKGLVKVSVISKELLVDGKDLADLTKEELEHSIKNRKELTEQYAILQSFRKLKY